MSLTRNRTWQSRHVPVSSSASLRSARDERLAIVSHGVRVADEVVDAEEMRTHAAASEARLRTARRRSFSGVNRDHHHAAQGQVRRDALAAVGDPRPPQEGAAPAAARAQEPQNHVCVPERPLGCQVRAHLPSEKARAHGVYLLSRHFVKDELPRIRYANPRMDIQVNKLPKTPQDNFKPEVTLELRASQFFLEAFVRVLTLHRRRLHTNTGRRRKVVVHYLHRAHGYWRRPRLGEVEGRPRRGRSPCRRHPEAQAKTAAETVKRGVAVLVVCGHRHAEPLLDVCRLRKDRRRGGFALISYHCISTAL